MWRRDTKWADATGRMVPTDFLNRVATDLQLTETTICLCSKKWNDRNSKGIWYWEHSPLSDTRSAITVRYLSLQWVMFTISQLCKILRNGFSYFKHFIYFQMVFQFLKSTNCGRLWQVVHQNMLSPFLVIEKAGTYLPRNTALSSPPSSAMARLLISSQRNIIEVMCVPRSSCSLFPSTELEYQFACSSAATMQAKTIAGMMFVES